MWFLLCFLFLFSAAIFVRVSRLEASVDGLVGKSAGFSADINRMKLELSPVPKKKAPAEEEQKTDPVKTPVIVGTDSKNPTSQPELVGPVPLVKSLEQEVIVRTYSEKPEYEPELAAPSPLADLDARTAIQTHSEQTKSKPVASARPEKPVSVFSMSVSESILRLASFLSKGTAVVYSGLVVFLFGVAFMIRHASASDILSVELVVCGVMGSALVMLAFGWVLVKNRRTYALMLQGGAVAVLYTCLFVAGEVYSLFPIFFAFCAMVSLTGLSCFLAVSQNARQTALIGMAGGFLAPLLSPAANASLVFLWGYYLVLATSILAVARFRSWRELNAMGFFLTVAVAMFWGYYDYRPALFWQVEPFLILFFLFYSAISMTHILKNPDFENDRTSQTLILGVPICFVAFQAAISKQVAHALPVTCVALSVCYLAQGYWVLRTHKEAQKLLATVFLGFALVFGNFGVLTMLGTQWAVYFLTAEASFMIWLGTEKKSKLPYGFGIILHGLSAFVLFVSFSEAWAVNKPAIAGIAAVFVSVSSLFSALRIHRAMPFQDGENIVHWILALWGFSLWFAVSVLGATYYLHIPWRWNEPLMLFLITVNMMGLFALSRRLSWPVPGMLTNVLGLCLAAWAVADSMMLNNKMTAFNVLGFPIWICALSCHYFILCHREHEIGLFMRSVSHRIGLWLSAFLICMFAYAVTIKLGPMGSDWCPSNVGAALGLFTAMVVCVGSKLRWPVAENTSDYLGTGLLPLVLASWGWTLWACLQPGNPRPMEYIPVANPLEISQAVCLLAVWAWMKRITAQGETIINLPPVIKENLPAAFFGTVILCLTMLTARIVHHHTNVRFTMDSLFMSVVFQTSLSFFWSMVAVFIMTTASRSCNLRMWKMGSLMLFLVAGKLFLVDIFLSASLARGVSFLWVGALMVAVGYFGPMLPERGIRRKEAFA